MNHANPLYEKLAALAQFSYRINQEIHLQSLLAVIAEEASKILQAERSSVFIYDKDQRELLSMVAQGLQDLTLHFPANLGLIGYVMQTGLLVNVEDAYQDFRFNPESDRDNDYHTKSVLAAPLKNRHGEIIGVFQVLNKFTEKFTKDDEELAGFIGLIAVGAIENSKSHESLIHNHYETILRLASVSLYKDKKDVDEHLRRISEFSAIIAKELGLSTDEVELIKLASPLYDIGKIVLPSSVFQNTGDLTAEEQAEIKRHPIYGARILECPNSRVLEMARNIAIAHHERYDGSGYPHGLVGDAIPLEARIVALADVFYALISKRVYKSEWSIEEAKNYIRDQSGHQFDPAVVEAFFKALPSIQQVLQNNSTSFQS